jgi:thiamine-phosphate pyrophosphorylase
MDARLVAWARAVKARRRPVQPVLWLFTDAKRLPDPLPAIARLPAGLCGVVFRHDGVKGRAALGRRVARLCKARGLALTVSGDGRLAAALTAGRHLRGGHGPKNRSGLLWTASAHSRPELLRAIRCGALPVLSPVYPTPSHPGARGLGAWRWALLAGRHKVLALGGVTGANVRRLGRFCQGAGAIGALG